MRVKPRPGIDHATDLELDPETEAELRAMDVEDRREKLVQIKRGRLSIRQQDAEIERLKRQKELQQLRKETEGGSGMPAITPEMAIQIAEMPEAKQKQVIATYALFSSFNRGGGGDQASAALLPLLMGFQHANPSAGGNELMAYAKGLNEQLVTGFQLANSIKPAGGNQGNFVEIFNALVNLVRDGVQAPMKELVERIGPQQGFFETLVTNPSYMQTLQGMGFFTPQNQQRFQNDTTLIEVEKIRSASTQAIAQMNLEQSRRSMDFSMEMMKSKQQEQMLNSVLNGPLATVIGSTIEGVGEATKRRIGGPSQQPPPQQSLPQNQIQPLEQSPQVKAMHPSAQAMGKEVKRVPPIMFVRCRECGQEFPIAVGVRGFSCPNPECQALLDDGKYYQEVFDKLERQRVEFQTKQSKIREGELAESNSGENSADGSGEAVQQ